jgi:recombination protein RecR
MMINRSFSPLIDELITAFRCLPGVGPKSAQRMALQVLQHNKEGGKKLADTLALSLEKIRNCRLCRTLCEDELCRFCNSAKRDQRLLCIVEAPHDILAIEQTGYFNGLYYVLMGNLSPLDGIGPTELGLGLLEQRFAEQHIQEVVIATSGTVEGMATAHYIAEMAEKYNITASQLAQGVPLGGELDYIDNNTLAHAFNERRKINR